MTDPSKLHLENDLKWTQHYELQNTTLLHDYDDENDEATDDALLELEMPSPAENYFCDIPS